VAATEPMQMTIKEDVKDTAQLGVQ